MDEGGWRLVAAVGWAVLWSLLSVLFGAARAASVRTDQPINFVDCEAKSGRAPFLFFLSHYLCDAGRVAPTRGWATMLLYPWCSVASSCVAPFSVRAGGARGARDGWGCGVLVVVARVLDRKGSQWGGAGFGLFNVGECHRAGTGRSFFIYGPNFFGAARRSWPRRKCVRSFARSFIPPFFFSPAPSPAS